MASMRSLAVISDKFEALVLCMLTISKTAVVAQIDL
jgi:hypothetical protein